MVSNNVSLTESAFHIGNICNCHNPESLRYGQYRTQKKKKKKKKKKKNIGNGIPCLLLLLRSLYGNANAAAKRYFFAMRLYGHQFWDMSGRYIENINIA
jgi:hypothetical protein